MLLDLFLLTKAARSCATSIFDASELTRSQAYWCKRIYKNCKAQGAGFFLFTWTSFSKHPIIKLTQFEIFDLKNSSLSTSSLSKLYVCNNNLAHKMSIHVFIYHTLQVFFHSIFHSSTTLSRSLTPSS